MTRVGRFVNKLNPIKVVTKNRIVKKLNKMQFEINAVKVENNEEKTSSLTVVGFETVFDLSRKLFLEGWNISIKLDGDTVYSLEQPGSVA